MVSAVLRGLLPIDSLIVPIPSLPSLYFYSPSECNFHVKFFQIHSWTCKGLLAVLYYNFVGEGTYLYTSFSIFLLPEATFPYPIIATTQTSLTAALITAYESWQIAALKSLAANCIVGFLHTFFSKRFVCILYLLTYVEYFEKQLFSSTSL